MQALLASVVFATVFVASHIGLAGDRARAALVARLGETGFRVLYFAVASASFTLLVVHATLHRGDGPAGLALGRWPTTAWPLAAVSVLGVVFMVAGLTTYRGSPYDLTPDVPPRDAHGLERVTRHPFFAGMALFASAHALLASHLVGTVAMLALALLAAAGARHQDRKLVGRRGPAFAAYLRATSAVPFAAIVGGRQRLVWRELPSGALVAGVVVASALRWGHEGVLAHGGAWIAATTVGGAVVLGIGSLRRAGRRRPDLAAAAH